MIFWIAPEYLLKLGLLPYVKCQIKMLVSIFCPLFLYIIAYCILAGEFAYYRHE